MRLTTPSPSLPLSLSLSLSPPPPSLSLSLARSQAKEVTSYENLFANPLTAARRGYIDDVIAPEMTRQRLCKELDALYHKDQKNPPRKHGNLPL